MKSILPLLLLFTLPLLAGPPPEPVKTKAPPAVELKPGIYHVVTEGLRGESEGAAVLRKTGASWLLTYDGGAVGIGLRSGNLLSVGWRVGQGHGVTVYQIGASGKLEGKYAAGNGETYSETLTLLKEFAD